MIIKTSGIGGLLVALALGACGDKPPAAASANHDAPTVTITDDEILLYAQVLGDTARIEHDTSPEAQVFALTEALHKTRARPGAIDLLVVRVEDSVVKKVVDRVLVSARTADYRYVLAHREGDGWAVVEPPVAATHGSPADEQSAQLSLLIDEDGFWVGTSSEVPEFHKIDKTRHGHDFAALDARLAERKAAAHFVGRRDIEIAADATTDFDTLRRTVGVAVGRGFSSWSMLRPYELSARPVL